MKKEQGDLVKRRFDFKRFLFGILFGIIILLSVFLLNKPGFFVICAVFISLSVYELYGLFDLKELSHYLPAIVLSVAVAFSQVFLKSSYFVLFLFLSLSFLWFKSVFLFGRDNGKSILADTFSLIYAGFFISFLSGIFNLAGGRWFLFLLLVIIWASDIFAYYGGRHLGRHKLATRLSPKKTIEGSLSGFIAAIIIAFILRYFIKEFHVFGLLPFLALTAVTVITGMVGDLTESLLKRVGNKKDSGVIIPGHGGILDRMDSLILSAPFFYYMIKLFAKF